MVKVHMAAKPTTKVPCSEIENRNPVNKLTSTAPEFRRRTQS